MFRIPETVSQRILIAHIGTDRQIQGQALAVSVQCRKGGHTRGDRTNPAIQVGERIAQLKEVARQTHRRADHRIRWQADNKRHMHGRHRLDRDGRGRRQTGGYFRTLLKSSVHTIQRIGNQGMRSNRQAVKQELTKRIRQGGNSPGVDQHVDHRSSAFGVGDSPCQAAGFPREGRIRPGGNPVLVAARAGNVIKTVAHRPSRGSIFQRSQSALAIVAIFNHRVQDERQLDTIALGINLRHRVKGRVQSQAGYLI